MYDERYHTLRTHTPTHARAPGKRTWHEALVEPLSLSFTSPVLSRNEDSTANGSFSEFRRCTFNPAIDWWPTFVWEDWIGRWWHGTGQITLECRYVGGGCGVEGRWVPFHCLYHITCIIFYSSFQIFKFEDHILTNSDPLKWQHY